MVSLVQQMKVSCDAANTTHQNKVKQIHKEWEGKLSNATKDYNQTQEELKKTEASFFELVRWVLVYRNNLYFYLLPVVLVGLIEA